MPKKHELTPEEDRRYHDTWKLLKKHRDVVWSMELSVHQLRGEFQTEYDSSIEEFLDSAYLAGADLSGTNIEQRARSIERSNKMIRIVREAVDLLRLHHKYGETYYWVLYYTYLIPQQLDGVTDIIEQLQPHIRDISRRTYYNKRRDAVEALSSILWGYSAKDSVELLNEMIPIQ